jgi:hypothetical protein
MPPPVWPETHQFRFLAALTPAAVAPLVPLPPLAASQFLWLRHLWLAVLVRRTECLRRREEIVAHTGADQPSSSSSSAPPQRPRALAVERQLLPADLRQLEIERRAAAPPALPSQGPHAGR